MLRVKVFILLAGFMLSLVCSAQEHPNYKRIDSLKKVLSSAKGIQKVDCLNELCEEYWWGSSVRIHLDSISRWTGIARKEALKINYAAGIATTEMFFGVMEIFKENFLSAEKYLRNALQMFESINNEFGLGWCNTWLAQSLYSQNNFPEALAHYRRGLFFLHKTGDWDGEAKAWSFMGGIYAIVGNYDSSYFYSSKSLQMRQKMSDHSCVAYSLTNMGHLYRIAGSDEDALEYFRRAYNYATTHGVEYINTNLVYLEAIGNLFRAMNSVDSSYYYLQRAIQVDPGSKMKRISLAETLLKKGQFDSALTIFLDPVDHFRKGNDKWDLMRVLLDIAKAYHGKKMDAEALPYALESLSLSSQAGAKQHIQEAYKLLPLIYKNLGKDDSAFFYMEQYAVLKESIVTNQFRWKLSNYKEQEALDQQKQRISLLAQENKLKETKLKQETKLKWILTACLLISALSGLMIFKNLALKRKNDRLESKHRQSELQQHVTELEMQALRAQMNPHFIFNCLNSINRFILKNETEAASNYLTKFSRLIRMALTHSKKNFISLEDELEMLKLYLDMERLRFKDAFEYSIIFKNSLDIGNVFVPPLLLQPFAENAIWHGLMHKEGPGHLEIELRIDQKILTCTITDDGVGRSKAEELKKRSVEKSKSMGLQITTDRLTLLNKDSEQLAFFNIEDIINEEGKPAGTRVILKMNYKDLMEIAS